MGEVVSVHVIFAHRVFVQTSRLSIGKDEAPASGGI